MLYYVQRLPSYLLTSFVISIVYWLYKYCLLNTILKRGVTHRDGYYVCLFIELINVFFASLILCFTLLDRHRHFDSLSAIVGNFWIVDGTNSINEEVVGNVLLFIPFGCSTYLLLRTKLIGEKVTNSLPGYCGIVSIISIVFSITIELLQLILSSGMSQLSDVFHNSIGSIIGSACFGKMLFPIIDKH